ncbi:MAG: cell division protein FtsB [Gammaproteobacteria bacterium RBG_16_57_12]|nr:MAG: cell division protein FtsB [Gammaproteobacteria bacterium RBG_16_57_12]
MRPLMIVLIAILLLLQYRMWIGEGSIVEIWQLKQAIEQQQQENQRLLERNRELEAEVNDLKHGFDAIEERARSELGMIRQDETFYQIIKDPDKPRSGKTLESNTAKKP